MSQRASVPPRCLRRPRHPGRVARAILLGAALAVSATTAQAQADDYRRFLDAAGRLHEALEYERALQHVRSARASAKTADEQAAVSAYEGVLLAELNRLDEARTSFKEAFLLKPDVQLPVRVAPRIQAEAEAARAQARAELARLRPRADTPPRAEPPPTPPLGEGRPALTPTAAATPLVPAGLDAAPPTPSASASRRPPFVAVAFAVLAAGAGGAGTLFGLQSRTHVAEARAAAFQDTAAASLGDARGAATTANVLFASAGALALGAVVSGIVWLSTPPSVPPAAVDARGAP